MIYSVIVTYNGQKWIYKCINSLLDSNVNNKIIVIDNGSTDDTLDIIRGTYPQVELIESTQNLGFGKANNIGLKKAYDAGADYVFLLNQDAWVKADTLDKLVKAAENEPNYGVVSPIHLDGSGEKLDNNFSHYIAPQHCPGLYSDMWVDRLQHKVYKVDFVNAAAWLVNRKAIETVGGFNPIFFQYSEDDNYIHRLKYHSLDIGVYPHAVVYHDREDRPLPITLTDPIEVELRRLIITYTNPNEESSIGGVIRQLYKEILKNALFFRIYKVRYLLKLIRRLSVISLEIEQTKKISKTPGLNFL